MRALRSERLAAALLVLAAAAGLILANSPAAAALFTARDLHLDIPWLGLELSIGHWITDGLLAVFFFLAAIELRHELTHGELDSPRKALIPAIAAVGGVVVPAVVFLLIVREPHLARGWPVPTATDIAFALGVLAIVGRGLPGRVRALLLALAVIDDLIAILFIALFFTAGLNPLPLLIAVPVVLVFGWLGYRARRSPAIVAALIVLGLAAWVLVHLSGVHSTIAGVALGLALAPSVAPRVRHALEPISNAVDPAALRVHGGARRDPERERRGPQPGVLGNRDRSAARQAGGHHRGRPHRIPAHAGRRTPRRACRSATCSSSPGSAESVSPSRC